MPGAIGPIGPVPIPESDLIPISALQHLAFCERQCALIYVEGAWDDNRLTAEGRLLHERVHDAESETRRGVRIARGLRLRSVRLGLTGVADVVEFHRDPAGVPVPGLAGRWRPVPVEYKRGRPKQDLCDEVQVCAQAMCLEEMLGARIAEGSVFYGQPRRRQPVVFTDALRAEVEVLALRAREMIATGRTPPAVYGPKCRNCSLVELCKPRTAGAGKSARRYVDRMLTR